MPIGSSGPQGAVGGVVFAIVGLEDKGLPGGDPIMFPPGLEREVMRRTGPGQDLSREEFDRRFPAPSHGQTLRDIKAEIERLIASTADERRRIANDIDARLQRNGLPDLPEVSRILDGILGRESIDEGNAAGAGGMVAVLEIMPAWRSDP
jgi:hypothetical protein